MDGIGDSLAEIEDVLDEFDWGEGNLQPSEPRQTLSARSEEIGWPSTLPIELALKVAPEDEILEAYGISRARYADLLENAAFVAAYKNAVEMVKQEGMSFRLKAKLQAEALLDTSWKMIHDSGAPASVRADLIKSIVRWAELEPKKTAGDEGTAAQGLQININLSGQDQRPAINVGEGES